MKRLAEVWLAGSLVQACWYAWKAYERLLDVYVEAIGIALLSALVAWLWRGVGVEWELVDAAMKVDAGEKFLRDGQILSNFELLSERKE